ncbi:hypothetical protein DV736_g2740, partial [Chaetothyriales sp. CBS 134916]
MTEFIAPLEEIKRLPPEVHLLCPRHGDDDAQDRFDEDIEGATFSVADPDPRIRKMREARSRRKKFISCLQLLAYDGPESEQYQRYIWDSLDRTIGSCDICIRNYYVAKMHLLAKLREEYEESDVKVFFDIIDRRDQQRIIRGLDAAAKTLRELPENRRGTSALAADQLHAIFEALVCESFLRQEELVAGHFDEPFRLIQTRRPLKIREIVPATARFLFSAKPLRLSWANSIWARIDRPPTDLEWHWVMKDFLEERLQNPTGSADITRLWGALGVMVDKMDGAFISLKLFDLQPNVCVRALDHLNVKTDAVAFITHTFRIILEKAPDAFWHALGSISSQTVVEQIFNSPNFAKSLELYVTASEEEKTNLNPLSWVSAFLSSLKPGNRPAACRALVTQLFHLLDSGQVSIQARADCLEVALSAMLKATLAFSDHEQNRRSVERLVLLDLLDTVGQRLPLILQSSNSDQAHALSDLAKTEAQSLVRNVLALESQCLKADFETLTTNKTPLRQAPIHSDRIWKAIRDNMATGNVKLATSFLCGIMALPGLQPLKITPGDALAKDKKAFNDTFDKLTRGVSGVLEKISDFDPADLDELFKQQDSSMSLIAALFSADQATCETAIDLLKNISGESSRKEALSHIFDAFLGVTLYSLCWTLRRISNMGTFASVPRMLKTNMEILELLCDPYSGKLRKLKKLDPRDANAVQSFWSYQWIALQVIFRKTEAWAMEVHDKILMTEVCRDTMQFARQLFRNYDVFGNILVASRPERAKATPKLLLEGRADESDNLGSPVKTLGVMAKWLRLRDMYLADTLVNLITDMLQRLKHYDTSATVNGLDYVEEVANSHSRIKTLLTLTQKAQLTRAIDLWYGREQLPFPSAKKKQSTLQAWTNRSGAASGPMSKAAHDDVADITSNDRRNDKTFTKPLPLRKSDPPESKQAVKQKEEAKSFIEERKRERERQKARAKEAAARMRAEIGIGAQTKDQSSGISGIGVLGKDHSVKKSDLMVSSDSESDDDSDQELFGKMPTVNNKALNQAGRKPVAPLAPTKKIKQVRSQKDVRARLAPDLSSLHKTILSWDFFADTDLPPNSDRNDYSLVTSKFFTAADYQTTFEPLLILEGWQSFRSAREEGNFKSFEFKVANSLIIDSFFEINSTVSMAEGKELGIVPSDVVLLSKSPRPDQHPQEPHCLARVKEVRRQKGEMTIVYRVSASNNPLRPYLNDKATVFGVQILSLTPLEREYGALMALPYYDLCDEIIAAKPSPLLNYDDSELQQFIQAYDVNKAQAKAVKSAVDNDAFTLIQGPPGSGKTKTICAIVGAIMTGFLSKSSEGPRLNTAHAANPSLPRAARKVLVCAPSNAAVDELVMRFKKGVKTMHGSTESLSVIRLGRSEAINAQVKDVTLEELVNARLNMNTSREQKEDIHAVMMEHKAASDQLNELRDKMNIMRSRGEAIPPTDEQAVDGLRRKKAILGTKIDNMREKQNTAVRDAELHRKRIQQELLDSAHVLCATLSGSGHEIFQGLNVEFETVIIDEAAQSIELSALIPLKYGCSKCILVGDPKQLPPTVLSREAARFQYEQSLFARMESNHKKDVHLLDTQYRMHPEISLFPSRMFYDSRLKDGPKMAELRTRPWHHSNILAPYRFFDVQGMSEAATKGHSLVNIAELKVAMKLYDRLVKDVPKYDFKGRIGIITPYKGQLKELKLRFKQRYGDGITSSIEFNTTDAFQGRESEIIIFSCVRASTKGIGFLNDIRRMNVGLTRAKSSLWVLGNSQSLMQGEFWRGLVNNAKERNLYTDGDIHGLLSRPLLTEDMMKDDVEMTGLDSPMVLANGESSAVPSRAPSRAPSLSVKLGESRRASAMSSKNTTPHSSRPPSAMCNTSSSPITNAQKPGLEKGGSSSTRIANEAAVAALPSKPTPIVSKKQVPAASEVGQDAATNNHKRPSSAGGRDGGLSRVSTCGICGSDKHTSLKCSDEEAKQAKVGNCHRCFKAGHLMTSCDAPRCHECGEVGHKSTACSAPARLRLTNQDKQAVLKQERRFEAKKNEALLKRQQKQMGDHDPRIPDVKTTALTEPKRKREGGDLTHGYTVLAPPLLPCGGGSSSSGPGRTLNPKGFTNPLINDGQTYSLLQAAREWSLHANMIRHRPRNESLGDSWWAELLPNAMGNPFLMHAILATGGTYVAVKTKCTEQTPGVLFHNIRSMSLLRQHLTLMLLSAFAFYVGDSRSGIAHLRAAHSTIKSLGGFGNVPWAPKTFLISALVAISTQLKLKPIIPIEEWDEGPLDEQLWMSSDIKREIDAAAGIRALWSAPTSSSLVLLAPSSPPPSKSLGSDDPSFSWRNWLLPTKHLFSLLDFVKSSSPSAQSPATSLLQHWIHNRRFVIKARLLEEYLNLIDTPKVTFPGDLGVHRRLDACSCLALIFCQSLIMFDVPQLTLMHEPRQQLGSLILEVFQPTIRYGSQQDHETLLWVTFVGAACELTLNPSIMEAMTTSRQQAWFSTTFLQCTQALSMKTMNLHVVFNKFIWHEEKFLPHLYALEEMKKTDCIKDTSML